MKSNVQWLAVLLCACVCTTMANADIAYTIPEWQSAPEDATVDYDHPVGQNTQLYLYRNVMVQWDLPSGGESITSVSSATARIYLIENDSAGTLNIYRLTEEFDEDVHDMYNMPAYDPSIKVEYTLGSSWSYNYIDVSTLLAANGDKSTFGIVMDLESGAGKCYSGEHATASYHPRFAAEYTTVPEPTTMVLLMGGFAAALLRRK